MSKRPVPVVSVLIAVGVLLSSARVAADPPRYTGVKDCGLCHKKELMGDQLGAWRRGPHARAFATLATEAALEVAKERGLTAQPQESDDCLRCHATAFGLEPSQVARKPLVMVDGVQCESCHGPGSGYRKNKVMADREASIAAGMWEPGRNAGVCTGCHNAESPTWDEARGFDHAAMKEAIAHPIPADVRGRYLELEKMAREEAEDPFGEP